jgi:5'-3' exonuclease
MINILKQIDENNIQNPTFIFVDGSYYCFYRYFATIQWWNNAHPEIILEDPYENEIFVEKFKKTFLDNMLTIPKKLKLDKSKSVKPFIIVGKDCKRENIWRMNLFSKYKANRENDSFKGKLFFKMVYEEELFQKGGAQAILKHPKLEADDCIALSVKYLTSIYPSCNIYIITSDKDYLQLSSDNVFLYNLSYKNLAESKGSTGNPKNDLEIKIIMGDTSDNIPSVFPKCGPKTSQKCIEEPDFFKKKMADNAEYYKQYELNKLLIKFDNIPLDLVNEFMDTIIK